MKRNRVLIAAEDYQFLDTVHGAAMIVQEWQVANSLERIAELVATQPLAVVIDLEAPCFDAIEVLKLLASLRVESRIVLLAGDDLRKLTNAKRAAASEGLQVAGTLTRPLTMLALSRLLEQHAEKSNPISVEELANGIAGHELVLHYQPILSRVADCYVIRGAEALVRWQHPARGLLYPGQFLKVAETGGLLGDLTDFVLGEATRQAGSWESRRMDVGISINMSPGLVNDSGFVERFMRVLREHDVSPQRVTLELIEAASPRDREMLRDVLTRLRLHGISLSLDDFGTGYSSLTELCRLPFNEIKIDRTLVHDVPDLREASTVVQAIVELAHRLSIRVCAEGVETVAAREFLTKAGCDSMQGVLFARPMPAAELEVLLARADGDALDMAEAANA